MTAYIFLPEGFEETEAVTTFDILVRAGIKTQFVSLADKALIKSRNGANVEAGLMFSEMKTKSGDALIFPGGPVLDKYRAHSELKNALISHNEKGGLVAAICAAPVFLAEAGVLKGKSAVCFPSPDFEEALIKYGAKQGSGNVNKSKNVITANGPGQTANFALAVVAVITGNDVAEKVRKSFIL